MKHILLLLVVVFCLSACGDGQKKATQHKNNKKTEQVNDAAEQPLVALLIDWEIYVGKDFKNLRNTKIKCSEFDISPDGKLVAYTAECKTKPGINREIHCADIENNSFKALNINTECYMGCWDKDAKFLAINFFDHSQWKIILYNIMTDKYEFIDHKGDLYQPWFSNDGTKLIAHNLENLYLFGYKDGTANLEKTINISNLGISSATKFLYCNINTKPMFIFTNEEYTPESDYPNMILKSIDTQTNQIQSLTDKKLVTDYTIDSKGNIYYISEENEKYAVYKLIALGKSELIFNSNKPINCISTKF